MHGHRRCYFAIHTHCHTAGTGTGTGPRTNTYIYGYKYRHEYKYGYSCTNTSRYRRKHNGERGQVPASTLLLGDLPPYLFLPLLLQFRLELAAPALLLLLRL
jgi:hypothetical protein